MGATVVAFSPLADNGLPDCDTLYLPGGYPELHLKTLERNEGMKASIRAHHEAGKPIVAECGGLLYLLERLTDGEGDEGEMVGLLAGQGRMTPKVTGLGSQQAELPEGTIRGHTFHHSLTETPLVPATHCRRAGGGEGEAVYRDGRLTAGYLHLYFPSNPEAAARLFRP